MSVFMKQYGQLPMMGQTKAVRFITKNIGNGGNRMKSWEFTELFAEVVIHLPGKYKVSSTTLDEEWVKEIDVKVLLGIKTYLGFDQIKQDTMTVVPISEGLDKFGFLKAGRDMFLLTKASPLRGEVIDRIETDSGLGYVRAAIKGAAKIAVWHKLGIVYTQKDVGVDNRYLHKLENEDNGYQWSWPTCARCLNRLYVERPDKPVSEAAFDAGCVCSMTGEEIDDRSAAVGNDLTEHDHGLIHGLKGHYFLYGDKVISGGRAEDDGASAKVSVGRKSITMSELRDADFEYIADRCPMYAPGRVLPERAMWTQDLDKCYLPNMILHF